MPQGKYAENRFNQSLKHQAAQQVSRKQCEHHSLTHSASEHTRKTPRLPPRHLPHDLHYKPTLKIDSSLDSKKKPRRSSGFFGLIGRGTAKHVTALPPGVWCVTSTSPAAYATPHCSHPLSAPPDTSPQTKTVTSWQHATMKHHPAQSRNHSCLHPPQESEPLPALLWQHGPSSFQLWTSHHSLQNQPFPFNRPRGITKAANWPTGEHNPCNKTRVLELAVAGPLETVRKDG